MKPSILAAIEFPCGIGDMVWVMNLYRKCPQCGGKKVVTIKGKRWCCLACNPDGQQVVDTPVKGRVVALSVTVGQQQHRQVMVEFLEPQHKRQQLRTMGFLIDSAEASNRVYPTKAALLNAVPAKERQKCQPGYCNHH